MKILTARDDLLKALELSRPLWNAVSVNQNTHSVLLTANGAEVEVASTNLDISFRRKLGQVTVREHGTCAINARKLAQVLTELRTDVVEISADDKRSECTLEGGRCRFTIYGTDPGEFPKLATGEGDVIAQLAAADFADAIRKVGRSIAQAGGRYALNGVLLEPRKNALEFCGTDGCRLSYCKVPAKGKEVPDQQVIVPRAGFELIAAACSGEMRLSVGLGWLEAVGDMTAVRTQLVSGMFPNWRSVIPGNDKKFAVELETMRTALKQAATMTSIEVQGARFRLREGALTLQSKSPGFGSGEVTIDADCDHEADLCFDPELFIQALAAFDSHKVSVEFKDHNTGAIIHGGDKDRHFHLVMPIDM